MYSTENPNTLPSLIASFIKYLCKHFSNISVVTLPSCDLLSGNLGVPVNPKYCAFSKWLDIALCISPNCVLWHSSIINTTLFFLYSSNTCAFLFIAFDIFCIVVTINFLLLSFICFINDDVLSTISTESGSNLLNSDIVWLSKSRLSTKKNTFSIFDSFDNIWLALNEVSVLPLPVVCHT